MVKNHVQSPCHVASSDRQGVYAFDKDAFLNCFDIPKVSVFLMADWGDLDGDLKGLTWQISMYMPAQC